MLAPRCTFLFAALSFLPAFTSAAAPAPAGKAKHVVIVVMDGLRRDAVTDEDMPTLAALAKSGTFFASHHPAYVSSTEVNGSSLATGMFPRNSGVVGNREYRPDVELLQPVDIQGEWASWRGDALRDQKWLRAATLPEQVRAAGMKTAVAGTKGVALLWDRGFKNRSVDQPTIYNGSTIPGAAFDAIVPEYGPIPTVPNPKYFANTAQDTWTTRVLTEKLWADGLPALSVLWLSEPDYAQHGSGPGSKTGKLAQRSSDAMLARVLAKLDEKKVRDVTDVLVVSDHGFSTVTATVDVFKDLWAHKFDAGGAFVERPEKGSIVVVGLGGSVFFYVVGSDRADVQKLVDHLQTTPWAGVIFTKDGLEGTFKHADAGIDAPDAPDVVVGMRWADQKLKDRLPGALLAEGNRTIGAGTHGSLSKYDMTNTLIAAGPDFKSGFVNQTPSGNADVAPTVLHLLGVDNPAFDGRVLEEALATGGETPSETTTLEARRTVAGKTWRQYLKVSRVGKRFYLDEGNGAVEK